MSASEEFEAIWIWHWEADPLIMLPSIPVVPLDNLIFKRMVWGGMQFLDTSHLQELINEIALKIGSLIQMDAFWVTIYPEKVIPEMTGNLSCGLIFTWKCM